ncbi:unnamed protein product, partial [Arabidopsis halleri]
LRNSKETTVISMISRFQLHISLDFVANSLPLNLRFIFEKSLLSIMAGRKRKRGTY